MIDLDLGEIAEIVDGQVSDGDASTIVSGPATLDSRDVPVGGLFLAIDGARVDGHHFAADAVAAGAAAVLASREVGVPSVLVPDVQVAVGALARHVLQVIDPTVVALTGSQGKTSVKDLLAHLVAGERRVTATLGNHNNELGVPLTVLRADADTEVLIVEMGARGIGHVAELCRIAPPDIAAVLNVGTAHLSEFGSRDAIAQAKGEIIEALPAGGLAVLNADDERVAAMQARSDAPISWFGSQATGERAVVVRDVVVTSTGRPLVTIEHRGRTDRIEVPLLGRHQALNLAAAIALAEAVGIDDVVGRVGDFAQGSVGRGQVFRTAAGFAVIDDTYNANPESMRAGIDSLVGFPARRRVVVLGEMRELGESSQQAHRAIGAHAARAGLDRIVVIGHEAVAIAEGARDAGAPPHIVVSVPVVEDAVTDLSTWLESGDAVLVKASRGAALERVVHALTSP